MGAKVFNFTTFCAFGVFGPLETSFSWSKSTTNALGPARSQKVEKSTFLDFRDFFTSEGSFSWSKYLEIVKHVFREFLRKYCFKKVDDFALCIFPGTCSRKMSPRR